MGARAKRLNTTHLSVEAESRVSSMARRAEETGSEGISDLPAANAATPQVRAAAIEACGLLVEVGKRRVLRVERDRK
jgi:hypothetical protein